MFLCLHNWNSEEGNGQESTQSSTTLDQHTEWDSGKNTRKHHIPESQEVRLSQHVTTRLQQGRHHSLSKTRRVLLRDALFSPKFLNMNRVESAMGWSTVLDCGMS